MNYIYFFLPTLTTVFFILNYLVKNTNWYKNHFAFTHDIISSKQRKNIDVINLGSNPARFGLSYKNYNGINLSSGTQGLDFDLKIFSEYHFCLKEGGTVIIPLVPFTSISAYLDEAFKKTNYYCKFVRILPKKVFPDEYIYNKSVRFIKYPILINPKSILRVIKDCHIDDRLRQDETPFIDWDADAKRWIKCWTDEFHISSLETPLKGELLNARIKSLSYLNELIDTVISKGYKVAVISPPISIALRKYYNPKVKEIYLDSFIKELNRKEIPYHDYTYDENFIDNSLYLNALFLNNTGREKFTEKVMEELRIN